MSQAIREELVSCKLRIEHLEKALQEALKKEHYDSLQLNFLYPEYSSFKYELLPYNKFASVMYAFEDLGGDVVLFWGVSDEGKEIKFQYLNRDFRRLVLTNEGKTTKNSTMIAYIKQLLIEFDSRYVEVFKMK